MTLTIPLGRAGAAAGISRRACMAGIGAGALVPLQASIPARAAPTFDAVVGAMPAATAGRRFASLQEAIDAAASVPQGQPWRIALGEGRYRGQFRIERPNVEIHGQGAGRSVLFFDAAAGWIAPDGKPYGTFRTWCLSVTAPDVRLHGLTIANTFDAAAEMRRPGGMRSDEGGSQQALALSLGRGADRTIVSECEITSHQDTLYCAEGRALFFACLITGSYDFIFGGSAARFERCEIRSLPRIDPVEGYITAPNTVADQPAGLVFDACALTAETGVPDGSVFLGRPWGVSTMRGGVRVKTVGMAAYLRCLMGPHIAPAGWTNMWYTDADGKPAFFEPEDARFMEFGNTGPGASPPFGAARTQRRGRIIDAAQAAGFSREQMFRDWQPEV
ncbi:pectinesterase family protein [Novosphingobium kaempferiae]|uniref:pectinesterase family protein n=1 Tax=Novosphingobium kaempferiae TaxID=2896849 RepID=UPI001E3F23C4|nr:pectinesterase family protein [Novosphingobium kaempferiae]